MTSTQKGQTVTNDATNADPKDIPGDLYEVAKNFDPLEFVERTTGFGIKAVAIDNASEEDKRAT